MVHTTVELRLRLSDNGLVGFVEQIVFIAIDETNVAGFGRRLGRVDDFFQVLEDAIAEIAVERAEFIPDFQDTRVVGTPVFRKNLILSAEIENLILVERYIESNC